MRRKRRGDADDSAGQLDSWLITFSDLCTLLLTFFVLLLSMSSLNQRAFRMVFHNFNASSGVLRYNQHDKVVLPQDMALKELVKSLESVYVLDVRDLDEITEERLETDENLNFLVSSGNALWIKKIDSNNAFSFIFGDKLLFESGTAQLNPSAYPLLDRIGEFLLASNYLVYVDGHTDSIPIHNAEFPSNRELSMARAYSVLHYLKDQVQVPARRLAMGGYGSSHPLAENTSAAGRALNRRVEIIMKKPR